MIKKLSKCAFCGQEITDRVFRYMDNFLQVKYFEELDGSDNMFCSSECAGRSLMLEDFLIDNYPDDSEDYKEEETS
jgi:hypothetical protein